MKSSGLAGTWRPARLQRSLSFVLILVLLTIALPVGIVGAAPPDATVTIPGQGTDLTVSGGQVIVPISITPASDPWSGTLSVVLYFTQGATTTQGVYNSNPLVYGDVYNKTLDVAYAVPAGFGPNGIRVGAGSTYSLGAGTVNVYVYLTEKPADSPYVPPDDGGSSGGTTDVPVDSGHAVVDSGGEVTVYLDPAKTESIFDDAPPAGAVLVDVGQVQDQVSVTPQTVIASIPLGVADQAGEASVPSIMNMGPAGITLSPEVFAQLATDLAASAGSLGNLQISVTTSSGDEATSLLAQVTPANMVTYVTPTSEVITISFTAVNPATGRETPLAIDAASLQISYNPSSVTNPEHVGLFMVGSLIYVGGKVDPTNNTVSGSVSGIKEGKFVALEYNKTFDDIEGHWAKADVELMASKFVVNGMTDTTFEPDAKTTRAQFATMLVRCLGISEYKPAQPSFGDVAPDAWYYGFVEAAFRAGLVTGDAGTGSTFRPEASISREEMAALVVRGMKIYGAPAEPMTAAAADALLKAFGDDTSISAWARVEAAQAYAEGIILGRDGGKYVPLGNGTRAEGATMMKRYMKKVGVL